jgi:monoamine oxidase
MQDHFDVAIVGAGAAGIAAAIRLKDAALSTVIIEARDRIGGRASTFRVQGDIPLDLGCGWLHSANRNALVEPIEQAGFAIDRTPARWNTQSGNRDFGAADQRAYSDAFDVFEKRLADAADKGLEGPAAAYFDPDCRWNPLIDAVSGYFNGVEFDQVSVLDYAAYVDTEVNWRVRDGYGAGIAALAGSLDPVLGCAVTHIDHGKSPIVLSTSKGRLTARAVIVTVPTSVLADGRIVFHPNLPDKIDAAAGLPLGLANKAFLRLAEPVTLPAEGHFFGHIDRTKTGSYHLRPFGRPYIESYFGGTPARELELAGTGAMSALAIDELVNLLGSDFRRNLSPIVETAWATDPWSLGSYSHALPGHADARAVLAAPVDGRLFFARRGNPPELLLHRPRRLGKRAPRGGGGVGLLQGALTREMPIEDISVRSIRTFRRLLAGLATAYLLIRRFEQGRWVLRSSRNRRSQCPSFILPSPSAGSRCRTGWCRRH